MRTVADLAVTSCVVREAKGYSRQKGYLDRYAGSEYGVAFVPKVKISVCVTDDRAEEVADQMVRRPHRSHRRWQGLRAVNGLAGRD